MPVTTGIHLPFVTLSIIEGSERAPHTVLPAQAGIHLPFVIAKNRSNPVVPWGRYTDASPRPRLPF